VTVSGTALNPRIRLFSEPVDRSRHGRHPAERRRRQGHDRQPGQADLEALVRRLRAGPEQHRRNLAADLPRRAADHRAGPGRRRQRHRRELDDSLEVDGAVPQWRRLRPRAPRPSRPCRCGSA
jgi:hypothetical protein